MDFKESFLTLPAVSDESPLYLYMAGITHKDPRYNISREPECDIFVLEYILSGKGHLWWGDNYYPLQSGDVFFQQPGKPGCRYCSDRNDPMEKVWFNLGGSLMEALCDAYNMHGAVFFPGCFLKDEFLQAYKFLGMMSGESCHEFAVYVHSIIAALDRWRHKMDMPAVSVHGNRMKEYINRNWHKNISIRELAGCIHKSPAQALRIFRNDWGMTPGKYHLQQRIFRAKQYLENSDYPVNTLAGMLGFRDEFYFSNWFKKHCGSSPSLYRKKFRTGV